MLFYSTSQEPYNTEEMARTFVMQFANQVFSVGQLLAFDFNGKKLLALVVKDIEGTILYRFFFLLLYFCIYSRGFKNYQR